MAEQCLPPRWHSYVNGLISSTKCKSGTVVLSTPPQRCGGVIPCLMMGRSQQFEIREDVIDSPFTGMETIYKQEAEYIKVQDQREKPGNFIMLSRVQ